MFSGSCFLFLPCYLFRNLYWTDWNRESPRIETADMDGTNRRILAQDNLGLPNGLTFDPFSSQLCWVDAGNRKLETCACTFSLTSLALDLANPIHCLFLYSEQAWNDFYIVKCYHSKCYKYPVSSLALSFALQNLKSLLYGCT